jgi:hypothetical protein
MRRGEMHHPSMSMAAEAPPVVNEKAMAAQVQLPLEKELRVEA